jgi:hypothetical protein
VAQSPANRKHLVQTNHCFTEARVQGLFSSGGPLHIQENSENTINSSIEQENPYHENTLIPTLELKMRHQDVEDL